MLLNFVERVGNTVVLPPVDDDWGGVGVGGYPEGTCCLAETGGPLISV